MSRRLLAFSALLLALAVPRHAEAARPVNGVGLGAANQTPINLYCAPGDSIEWGSTTSNPPTTSWCNVACANIAASGTPCTVTNVAQPGSASWQWVGGASGDFNWTPPAPVAGKSNIAVLSIGSNDISLLSTHQPCYWQPNLKYPPNGTGHNIGLVGYVTSCTPGSSTTFTFSNTIAGRSAGDWIEVTSTGNSLDFTPFQITSTTSTTITTSTASTGTCNSTGVAYLNTDSAELDNQIFRATTGGTSGAGGPPAWSLSGATTDNTVVWHTTNLAGVLTDLQTNVTALADSLNGAGWHIVLGTVIPRTNVFIAPATFQTFDPQRQTENTYLVSLIGSHGIRSVIRWDQTVIFGTDGFNSCTDYPTYWSDCVHPTNLGSTYMATIAVPAILAAR